MHQLVVLMYRVALIMAMLTTLPVGFLQFETSARGGPDAEYAGWWLSDKPAEPLRISPCGTRTSGDKGRLAARTIGIDDPPAMQVEQLVLYRSERFARKAMDGLRVRLRKCGSTGQPLRLGDEAIRVTVAGKPADEGAHYVAVRRGSALIIYGTDVSTVVGTSIKLARAMTEKVCELPQEPCRA